MFACHGLKPTLLAFIYNRNDTVCCFETTTCFDQHIQDKISINVIGKWSYLDEKNIE